MAGRVQQMIQLAKTLFVKTRVSSVTDHGFAADLDNLKKLVSTLTAQDFNVDVSLAAQQWDYQPYVADSPAACIEVYECPEFSIGIFLLKPNKTMPLHDHPGMHGVMKILFGSMTVTSFSNEEARESLAPPTSDFLVRCTWSKKLTTDSEACCLYPDKGNIHEISASDEPVAFLDILGPPYSPQQGRDCNYYYRQGEEEGG